MSPEKNNDQSDKVAEIKALFFYLRDQIAALTDKVEQERLKQLLIDQLRGEERKDIALVVSDNEAEVTQEPPPFPGACVIDPLLFLEQHYAQRLKYFGAPKNTLFQNTIKDRKLYRSLRNKAARGKLPQGIKLEDILPRNSDRIDEEIQEFVSSPAEVILDGYRTINRLNMAKIRRDKRAVKKVSLF